MRTATQHRPQRKGPLKRVVKILRKSGGPYDHGVVQLECGHIVRSSSANRARCAECAGPPK